MGDSVLFWRARLLAPTLLTIDARTGVHALADAGRAVLEGAASAPAPARWVAGVDLHESPTIRWDPAARRLAA